MTTVVLAGFLLMLFAPCVFAIYGGRDKKAKTIAASYEDRAVNRTPEAVEPDSVEDEFDIPMRREEFLVQAHPPVALTPAVQVAVSTPPSHPMMWHEDPIQPRQMRDLRGIVEQAESEALVAHAMAAQANAAAMAATARAAQARAQAAAEHAVEANRAAANHAAAVREAQRYAAASQSVLADQPTWPELAVSVSGDEGSRRAA